MGERNEGDGDGDEEKRQGDKENDTFVSFSPSIFDSYSRNDCHLVTLSPCHFVSSAVSFSPHPARIGGAVPDQFIRLEP